MQTVNKRIEIVQNTGDVNELNTKRVNNLQLQDHKSPFIRQNDENKMISC